MKSSAMFVVSFLISDFSKGNCTCHILKNRPRAMQARCVPMQITARNRIRGIVAVSPKMLYPSLTPSKIWIPSTI